MTFGEKIKFLRETMEITQTQLATQVGMTQRKVSYIENDTFEPNLADITLLCEFFKVSADYLLGLPKDLPYPTRQ